MYKIREYDIKDKEELIKLWLSVCVQEHGFENWKEEISMLDESEYEKIIVAVDDDNIIGSMAYKKINEDVAELKRVYIYSQYRGKGIAKELYSTIMNKIKENNYKKVLVETWEKFASGRAFYYKNNFKLEIQENERYVFSLDIV